MSRVLLAICSKGEVQQESNCIMMAKLVFIYLAVYTLFLQLTRGMVKIFDLIPGYKVATVIFKKGSIRRKSSRLVLNFSKIFFLYLIASTQEKIIRQHAFSLIAFSCVIKGCMCNNISPSLESFLTSLFTARQIQ